MVICPWDVVPAQFKSPLVSGHFRAYDGTVGWAFLVVICPREVVNVAPAKKCKSPLVSGHFWAYDGTVGWGFLVVIYPREVVNVVPAKNTNHRWYLDISGPLMGQLVGGS